jgi:PAS domain S-box-containing protein
MSTSIRMSLQSDEQREIEQLRRLLAAERDARARLQSDLDLRNYALDAATTHFMIVDVRQPRWSIVYANRGVATAHGYEATELLGRSPAKLASVGEENAGALTRINAAVREGVALRTELIARRKDGSTFWVGMLMTPIQNGADRITHYLGIGADITVKLEQERAQRELQGRLYNEMQERERIAIELRLAQKLESVGRLAAGIAHEINTPIQYVGDSVSFLQSAQSDLDRLLSAYRAAMQLMGTEQGSATVLAGIAELENTLDLEFLSKEMPRAFERTLQGIERVAAIVRAMKEFAHPDAVEHCAADLNHAIETTLTVAKSEYKYAAQIETRFGELPLVVCNVGELNQVFLNLIVNASHAIAESGKDATAGRIVITTAVSGADVTVSIADNGVGISEENIEKVFDPFFTTKPVGKGTGQGLAIARSIIVEKHGGSIDIHGRPGGGACFELRLPISGRSVAQAA